MSIKLCLSVFTAIHWQACALRLTADFHEYQKQICTVEVEGASAVCTQVPVSWLQEGVLGGMIIAESYPSRQYVLALSWATQTLSTVGYGSVSPTTESEAIMMIVCMFVSSILFTYTMAETQHLVANSDETLREFNRQADNLNYFCTQNEIPSGLAIRLREYFRNSVSVHRANFFKTIIKAMSPTLRGEVSAFMNASLAKNCWFLVADDTEEMLKFVTEMTLKLRTKVFGPQEVLIRMGDRMVGMTLVRKGTAFGGKGNFGKVYTAGRWFGVEGLLVARRYTYEIRSLNFMICELFDRASLDIILWSGDFPGTYRKLRKAVMKMIFRHDFVRAAEVEAARQDAEKALGAHNRKQGAFVNRIFTPEESDYVKYGNTKPPVAVNIKAAAALGKATPSELCRFVDRVESRMICKVEDFTRKYVESKARIVDALRKYPPQQSGATAVRITGPSTSSLTLA
jgi:hypothetical protein